MIPWHRVAAIACPACCVLLISAGVVSGSQKVGCPVRGVWELVSVTNNGKDQPLNGAKQMKIVTASHWMWIGQDARRDTLPLKTPLDTLRRNSIGGGAGTYTTSGNTYVEHIVYFVDPAWLGKSWNATCRVEGNRWYHSYPFPQDSTGVPRDSIGHYVEVWQKIE
jgi:hypothetical protein